jgi:hypothetical protein
MVLGVPKDLVLPLSLRGPREKKSLSMLDFSLGSWGRWKRPDFAAFFEALRCGQRRIFQGCGVVGIAPEFMLY